MAGARSKSTYPNKVFSLMWSEVPKSFHLHMVRTTKMCSVTCGPIYEKAFTYFQFDVVRSTKKFTLTFGPK